MSSNNLVPQEFGERMKYCEVLASSSLVPSGFRGKPEDVFVAIEFGQMVGLNPMQALTNIAVINGRPSIWGDAALALVKASGKLEYINEYLEEDGDNIVAVCETKRKDEPTVTVRRFSKQDAINAGLWGNQKKDPWVKYPKRMLQMRARAWALRDAYPDVLSGIQIAEEMQDVEVVEETQRSEIKAETKSLPKKEEPLYKIVGNLLMEKYKDPVAIKRFVRQVLNLPEEVELKGKYLQNLTEDELRVLQTALQSEELQLQAEKA